MGYSAEPDLFGFIVPPRAKRRRPKALALGNGGVDGREELVASIDAALSNLSEEITDAIRDLQMEMAGMLDGDNAGEVDALLERLDEELTDAVRQVRRKVLW